MFLTYCLLLIAMTVLVVFVVKNIVRLCNIRIGFFELLFFVVVSATLPTIVVFSFPVLSDIAPVAVYVLILLSLLLLLVSSRRIKAIGFTKSFFSSLLIIIVVLVLYGGMQLLMVRYVADDLLLYDLKNQPKSAIYGVIYRFPIKYGRGDIVLHKHEVFDNIMTRSRIIGLPNETVTITNNNTVEVDGVKVEEPYVVGETKVYPWGEPLSYTVPPDHYYLLGDNRETVKDSRHLGPFEEREIIATLYPAPKYVQSIVRNFLQRKGAI